MDLVSVLKQLYESEIDVSLISHWDAGWQVEVEAGQVAREFVASPEEAARWFHEQALIHFPESQYAKTVRGEFREAVPVNGPARSLSGL